MKFWIRSSKIPASDLCRKTVFQFFADQRDLEHSMLGKKVMLSMGLEDF